MKDKFSMFQVNLKTADTNYLTFFVIPKRLENKFISNPELIRSSLDAKAIFYVDEPNVWLRQDEIQS